MLKARLWFAWGAVVGVCSTLVNGSLYLVFQRLGDQDQAELWQRWTRRWAGWIAWATGLHIEERFMAPLPDGPCVFVSNHQNACDIVAHVLSVPVPFGFVAKAELARVPVFGASLEASPCLLADRSSPRRAVESLKDSASRIRQGVSVLIYAEGARSHGPNLQPFKRGAFQLAVEAGVPVVPVTVVDAYKVLDERARLLRPGTIHVIYGSPLSVETYSRTEIPALMKRTRAQIEAGLQDGMQALTPHA